MIKKFLIKMIRLYQKYISPMKRTKCPYMVWKQSKNMAHLRAVFLRHGGYCDAILFPTEAMTLCHELFCDCLASFSRGEIVTGLLQLNKKSRRK